MSSCTFTIPGRCATKGSANSFTDPRTGRKVWKADNSKLAAWTKDAKKAAMAARVPLIYKPHGVHLSVRFEFIRPKTAKQTVPSVKPDLDKLARALFDALTGLWPTPTMRKWFLWLLRRPTGHPSR